MSEGPTADWTCSRCEVTVSWMPDSERPEFPASWVKRRGQLYCLSCRRELAEEVGLAELGEGAPARERERARSEARIEFELRRVPDRQDNRIASSCRTSVIAVRKARVRLGMQSRSPS